MSAKKLLRRDAIRNRVRKKISGTAERPRLSVFRSNKQIYAQVIDDHTGSTICAYSSTHKEMEGKKVNKVEQAKLVGLGIAKVAATVGVTAVVFDRGGYLYHGRVKSLAEAAREGGLKF